MALTSSFKVLAVLTMASTADALLTMERVGNFTTSDDPFEIIVTKPSTNHLFAAATSGVTVFVLDPDTLDPMPIGFYNATATHGESTSVAYNDVYDELAISVAAYDPLTLGQVHIISSVEDWVTCGLCDDYVQILTTGYLPDMVTFTPDGRRILTANEGEPLDYTMAENDPPGTVSIFKRQYSTMTYNLACEVDFEKFDKPYRTRILSERGMRITGKNFTTFSMDVEPEYIAVTANGNTAYVSLQENNAVAKIAIKDCEVKRIYPLGYKEWGNGMMFDASDKDGMINLMDWPTVKGMYQPDAIATFKTGGKRYFLTANEGDGREYGDEDTDGFYTDEIRVEDLADELGVNDTMYGETMLGRLKVTTAAPFDGDINELYAFGGRSISIFDGKSGDLVWDSGDFIETYTADVNNGFSDIFNSQGSTDTFDERSDDKGAEPEGLVVTEIDGRLYVFVALERIGGWMVWDITDAENPVFQSYTNSFEDDSAPESGAIIPAEFSPTGHALLFGAYEISNTIAVFQITT